MNISSLLEIIEPEINPTKQYKGTFKNSPNPEVKNQIGAGLFSRVTPSKKDPHTVKKYTRNFLTGIQDAFHTYADYIYQNKLWENPYFPRIYKQGTIEDKQGKTLNKYEIEKLSKINSLSRRELLSIFENVFSLDANTVKEVLKDEMVKDFLKPSNTEHVKIAMGHLMAKLIDQAVRENLGIDRIKDDNLKNAIQHLQKLGKTAKLRFDLHSQNIMARRTPHGTQIVITDPFSSKR